MFITQYTSTWNEVPWASFSSWQDNQFNSVVFNSNPKHVKHALQKKKLRIAGIYTIGGCLCAGKNILLPMLNFYSSK